MFSLMKEQSSRGWMVGGVLKLNGANSLGEGGLSPEKCGERERETSPSLPVLHQAWWPPGNLAIKVSSDTNSGETEAARR